MTTPATELSLVDREILQAILFQNPLAFASLIQRVANARHVLVTLTSNLTNAVPTSQSAVTPTILTGVTTPPVSNVGIVLDQYVQCPIAGVTFNGIKDGNVIINTRRVVNEFLTVPNPWQPFRSNYIMQYINANPLSSAGRVTARSNIVFIPNEVWNRIDAVIMAALNNIVTDLGFNTSGVRI